jgi:ABC-type multidrug transport system ATPase subunit
VSTHHIDDVEVLSDRVWFLNERYLVFDGEMTELMALRTGAAQAAGKSTTGEKNSRRTGSSSSVSAVSTSTNSSDEHFRSSSSFGGFQRLDNSPLEVNNDMNCQELNFASSDTQVDYLLGDLKHR